MSLFDGEYHTMKNGKFLTVPEIDKICDSLKERYTRQSEDNERLREENHKLKTEVWKDEEIVRLKKEIEDLRKEYAHGFPISEDEWTKIRQFMDEHKGNYGAIGGGFVYEFLPTSIGVAGTIKAMNGDELQFREID